MVTWKLETKQNFHLILDLLFPGSDHCNLNSLISVCGRQSPWLKPVFIILITLVWDKEQLLGMCRTFLVLIQKLGRCMEMESVSTGASYFHTWWLFSSLFLCIECLFGDLTFFVYVDLQQEQVLDRQDTDEERRLLAAVKRVAMQHAHLGWTSEFSKSHKVGSCLLHICFFWDKHACKGWFSSSYSTLQTESGISLSLFYHLQEMHHCFTVVACHHSFTPCWRKLILEVYCKVNSPIVIKMHLQQNTTNETI